MQWFAQAPSNIALIKYMGKKEASLNIPSNSSLSYTLNDLQSNVVLEAISGKKDNWETLEIPGAEPFILKEQEQNRFLAHLERIKTHFNYTGGFLVRSSNNFPASTGLASSASSFAALTKCAVIALSELTGLPLPSVVEQANLSRLGSGSSCRSFFSPWALWNETTVKAVVLPYETLSHQVILASHESKEVSSREAHARIVTSPLYPGRGERAEENLKLLLDAFNSKNWTTAYEITWREFQDMHQLFETAAEPFSYMTKDSLHILNSVRSYWDKHGDGPLVTMDAGPNVHLLYRSDQKEMMQEIMQHYWVGNYDVI